MSESAGGPPPDITFRRAVPADWAQLRAARLTALTDAPYAFASTLQREQAFTEETWRSRTQTSAVFAAWAGGEIIGMVSVRRAGPDGDWHLVGMWVSPALRGCGVADRLLRNACAYARAEGAAALTLWVTEINDRARGFYRRLGFAPTGGRQLVRPDEPDHWEEELALTFG
jgi:ribosomal protein S18 acetylase RimI-like enzyme